MKTNTRLLFAMGLLLAASLSLSASLLAQPLLDVQVDPTGARITWDGSDGADYVLEASDDFQTWIQVNQSVVKEGDLHRVFVPTEEAKNFYRLVNDGTRVQAAYVGSETCKTCHGPIHESVFNSGHPYKLNRVEGEHPAYPFTDNLTPPEGYTWDDITWVIGGANYKARFIDLAGYIITGEAVQWNLETEEWVAYHVEDPIGTKPYNCGRCHTTGWVSIDDGGVHQDGQPGMHGSFAEQGIGCEACHGPGSRHVASLSADDIIIDTTSAMCGGCHIRGAAETIPASGGFIRHHEQYNEILSSEGKKNMNCVTCHNPHVSVKNDQGGITRDCTDCHSPDDYAQDFHSNFADCTTCHMPKATKTAVKHNKYVGDIMTHIFKISTDPAAPMFTEDGSQAVGGYVTLDFVCYQCHKDEEGIGGNNSTKTLQELAEKAQGFHD